MSLSMFLLGLYVFLQSAVYLAWFAVDAKMLGLVGMVFVVVLLVEAIFGYMGRPFPVRLNKG